MMTSCKSQTIAKAACDLQSLYYSQKLLQSFHKPQRNISKVPFKVLDAPDLQDDFYLNLVDWSSANMLG